MEDFWGAPVAAIRGQGLFLFAAIPEEEIVIPQDGRFMNLRDLGLLVERVFEPVLQNPDEYLMPRYAPFEELPNHWEKYSGDNYLGVQQHRQEELDALEQVEDVDDEEKTMNSTKASSQDVDAMPSASQHVTKRDDLTTDDLRLLKDSGSSSFSVATIGLQDSAMPGASPAAFGPILEAATTSEDSAMPGASPAAFEAATTSEDSATPGASPAAFEAATTSEDSAMPGASPAAFEATTTSEDSAMPGASPAAFEAATTSEDSAMPGASPAAFEAATTSEVQKPNI